MISAVFIMLASVCNAIMDTLTHHYYTSIFHNAGKKIKATWWNPALSWLNKYVDRDSEKGYRKLFWKINYPVQFTDAWHFFKMLCIIFICAAVVAYKPFFNTWIDFILLGCIWNFIFSRFYDRILIKK